VYQFVEQIDRSPTKRETRNELLRKIQLRDSQSMATNASTEAIAVRYVFADQSRQSRNNYTIAMEKARALDIKVSGFADFLAKNGGVGGVVETVFDHEAEEQATSKELADAKAIATRAQQQFQLAMKAKAEAEAEAEAARQKATRDIAAANEAQQVEVNRLNKETNAALQQPAIRKLLEAEAFSVDGDLTPAETTKFVADEIQKWSKIVRDANIQFD
jgi:hypothetical protein